MAGVRLLRVAGLAGCGWPETGYGGADGVAAVGSYPVGAALAGRCWPAARCRAGSRTQPARRRDQPG
ncbi:hypothetical protein NKG94_42740 [Micromonospora sp. M12]